MLFGVRRVDVSDAAEARPAELYSQVRSECLFFVRMVRKAEKLEQVEDVRDDVFGLGTGNSLKLASTA